MRLYRHRRRRNGKRERVGQGDEPKDPSNRRYHGLNPRTVSAIQLNSTQTGADGRAGCGCAHGQASVADGRTCARPLYPLLKLSQKVVYSELRSWSDPISSKTNFAMSVPPSPNTVHLALDGS